MKKSAVLLLFVLPLISTVFTSCTKKQDMGSSTSSGISSYEDVSSVTKTDFEGNFTFAFDPYVMPKSVSNAIGGNEEYVKLCDAVINKQTSVSVSSQKAYDNLRFAFDECFILSFLVKEFDFDSENSLILISYNYGDEHNTKIEEVKTAVSEIFTAAVVKNDKKDVAALSLYSYLAKNIDILGSNTVNNSDNTSSSISQTETETHNTKYDIYTALINKKANSQSVSKLYSFLLMQLSIDSKTVGCWQSGEYHNFNLISLDNKWYFCDILAEQNFTQAKGLKFFGMNRNRVKGYITAENIYTGQYNWFTDKLPGANSKKYDKFKDVISFELDAQRKSLDAFTEEYSRFVFKF